MKNALPGRSLALCPRCGERLSVDGSYASARCPFCGETFRVADGLRAFELGSARGGGANREPPRRKKHVFRWLLLCLVFFLAGKLILPGFIRLSLNARRTGPDRTVSAPAATAAPRPTATPRPAAAPTPAPTPRADGVSPEFKKYMDSYEAFFDEYLDFMESAEGEEDGFGYLLRYAEMMDSLDAIGEEELSTADELYYLEVLSRIGKKLMEASEEE